MADIIVGAFQQALNLIASGDPEVYATIYRTVYVSGLGTLMSCLWSLPLAVVIGLYNLEESGLSKVSSTP
jgi:ABC-type tungstate transport system substrate-binding protein